MAAYPASDAMTDARYGANSHPGVQQQRRRGLQEFAEAVDGVGDLVSALSNVRVDQACVNQYQQDDKDEYGADEPQPSSSFPPRPAQRLTRRPVPRPKIRASSKPFSAPSILDPAWAQPGL